MQQHLPESSATILPILSMFKDMAKKEYGQRLKKIILYGSYAKGTAKQDSDIDLMIVLSEMESAFNEIDRLNEIKFSIGLEYGVFISTNPVSQDLFFHSQLPIIKNVIREGIEV